MQIIHWFRRDLRLRDNPALSAAARDAGGSVIPVFILDDALLASPRTAAARVVFLLESLRELDAQLRERGSRLIIRRGRPAEVLPELAATAGAGALYYNRDYTPFARERDRAVARALGADGVTTRSFHDAAIVEPHELLTKSGRPYTVYTPYSRQWRAHVEDGRAGPVGAPTELGSVPEAIASPPLPSADGLGFGTDQQLPPGGETAGRKRLATFLELHNDLGVRGYGEQRNLMALPATSRLSPYLHFGCVAARTCLGDALRLLDDQRLEIGELEPQSAIPNLQSSVESWIGELAWRDFYTHILFHFPHVLRGAFKREYDGLPWENDERLFAAWREGRTGYPVVDAAMRQLRLEGWMHNRARMIVGSFLVKDLLIDWRWGERYFLQQLVDGDHAANNGGWQWVAGTGTDAQPYFRIFNPVSQGERFDPEGAYVRRYVPELAPVPTRYIHAPWTMPPEQQRQCGVHIGRDYPPPIVDHSERRARAMAMYRRIVSPA